MESTESVTDWANRTGEIGFLLILNTEAWENTEISRYSQTTSLTNSCLWALRHFFQIEHKKLLMFTPRLPTAALNQCELPPHVVRKATATLEYAHAHSLLLQPPCSVWLQQLQGTAGGKSAEKLFFADYLSALNSTTPLIQP